MHDDASASALLDELEPTIAPLFAAAKTVATLERAFEQVIARIDPRLFVLTSRAIQRRVLTCNQVVRNLYWAEVLRNTPDEDATSSSRAPTRRIRGMGRSA